MNEIILQSPDHDIVAFDGTTLLFAYGEDPWLYWTLFWAIGFFVFYYLGDYLRSFFQKKNILSGKTQSYVPFFLVFLLLLGSFIFMQKKFISPRVNVPLEERRNLLTIELPQKNTTLKEKNKIVETFTFSEGDYFYLSILTGNKSTTYSLSLLHNGRIREIVNTSSPDEIFQLQKLLMELGFFVKVIQ